MSTLSITRLPDFERIDVDICHHVRQYSAPPNSAAPSSARSATSIQRAEANAGEICYRIKSIYRDDEFQCFTDRRAPARLKLPAPATRKTALTGRPPGPCKVEPQILEFLVRPIADPRWNSTFCLERIKTLVTSPELGDVSTRVEEIWSLYLRKSPTGAWLKDVHELSKLVCYLDVNGSGLNPEYSAGFTSRILDHLKSGIRVKRMSDNNCLDPLRRTFDSFARILKFGNSKLRFSVLKLLEHWVGIFAPKKCFSCQERENLCPQDFPKRKDISANNRKSLEDPRSFKEERCKDCPISLMPEVTKKKCIVGCQVTLPQISEEPTDALLANSAFFGALESSILPSVLEQIIAGSDADEQYLLILGLIRKLCENSYCIRSCVLNSSITSACLLKLGYPDPEERILCRTVELFYSMLLPDDQRCGVTFLAVPDEESFEMALQRFMNFIICTEKGGVTRSLRNDFAFILFMLPYRCPPMRKFFGKHLRDFAAILANNILTEQSFEVVLDSTPEDLELVQYFVWILDVVIPTSRDYFYIIEMYQLVPVMVRLIAGPCALIEEAGTSSVYADNILKAAWSALVSFTKIQPHLFMHPEGIFTMLKTLSAFASGGPNVSLLLVEAFLNVLGTILITASGDDALAESIISYFSNRNAMEVFCCCLRQLTREGFSVSLETTICRVLICCSEMGKYDESQKVGFANKKGVKCIIKLLHMLLYAPAHRRHMSPIVHIMVADCVWNCIADCPTGLEMFLLYEGVFRMLDLLEIAASQTAKLHVMGALLDLCDYSRCADQMMYWRRQMRHKTARFSYGADFSLPRSRNPTQLHAMLSNELGEAVDDSDQSLSALFCKMWKKEEKRLKVLRDEDGVVDSLEYPTLSEYAREYKRKIVRGRPLPPYSPGPSCLDMIGSLRPRIHLLVKTITESTNTEASVFSGLGLKNQVIMQTILNYLDLKRSEIWLELEKELRDEGLTLVASDETALRCMLKICRNKVGVVINTQRYLIQRWREQAAMNEHELYNLLRNCQIQDHLMALREAQYYATLSDYYLLIDKRLWHSSRINDLFLRSEGTSIIKPPAKKKKSKPKLMDSGGDAYVVDEEGSALDLGPFGISLNVDSSLADMIPPDPDTRDRLPSQIGSPMELPFSPEGSHYQVSPAVLFKALTKLIARQKQWAGREMDEEREWLMRKKWNADWYPKQREHF